MPSQRQGGWIPAYSDLTRHQKTRDAAQRLGLKAHGKEAVAGYLVTLWNRAAAERIPTPDGGPIPAESIEYWAEWSGKRGAFLRALLEAGFVEQGEDGVYLHDWEDGGGKSVKQRTRWARNQQARRGAVRADNRDDNRADVRDEVRETDQTRPDQRSDPERAHARDQAEPEGGGVPRIDWDALDREVRESGQAERYTFRRGAL